MNFVRLPACVLTRVFCQFSWFFHFFQVLCLLIVSTKLEWLVSVRRTLSEPHLRRILLNLSIWTTVYLIIHWHMVFQTSVEDPAPMVSLGQMLRIYLVKVVGLQLTYVLHGHMAFMILFTGLSSLFHLLFHWEPGAFIFHLFHWSSIAKSHCFL